MHHCKIFWFRRGIKGNAGEKQLVEEEDRAHQVKHRHHPQQVWESAEGLTTNRARTSESLQSSMSFASYGQKKCQMTTTIFFDVSLPGILISIKTTTNKHLFNCFQYLQIFIYKHLWHSLDISKLNFKFQIDRPLKQKILYTKHLFLLFYFFWKFFPLITRTQVM